MLERMYSAAALRLQFEQGHQFLLMEQGNDYLGFAGFEHHYSATGNSRLHKLYVLPGTQGTGAGNLLLGAVIKASRSAGDLQLELNVNRFNSAKDFYLRRGFQVVREEVIDIGNGYVMDDFVLVRSI